MTDEDITRNLTMIEYYKEQLASIDMQIQYLHAGIADYQKAKISIENLDKTEGKPDILVPIGSGVLIHATATDTSKVLIDIGDGFIAEKTVDDAIKKLDIRIESLQKNQEKLYSMAQQIELDAAELSDKTQKMFAEAKK